MRKVPLGFPGNMSCLLASRRSYENHHLHTKLSELTSEHFIYIVHQHNRLHYVTPALYSCFQHFGVLLKGVRWGGWCFIKNFRLAIAPYEPRPRTLEI